MLMNTDDRASRTGGYPAHEVDRFCAWKARVARRAVERAKAYRLRGRRDLAAWALHGARCARMTMVEARREAK